MSWQKGVAFVRGINIYKIRRVNKDDMLKICKSVEKGDLKILGIVKTDNIVFEKRKIHYAEVSKRLEKALSKRFKEKVYVTSRSMRTIKFLAKI